MKIKLLAEIAIVALVAIFQIAFIQSLPWHFNKLNIAFLFLILSLFSSNAKKVLWQSIGLGLVMDIFSFGFFGLNLLAVFLAFLVVSFLFKNFFTDFSVYSFSLLCGFFIFFEDIIFNFSQALVGFMLKDQGYAIGFIYWKNLVILIAVNLLASLFLFYFLTYFSNIFKPVFLSRIKKQNDK